MNGAVIVALAVIASLSPLLTLAALWQVKEWRWDRLREHLRAEGWLRQLFGVMRPALVAGLIAIRWTEVVPAESWLLFALTLLALFGLLQLGLGRQRMPVWTAKAVILTATAFLVDILVAYARRPTPDALVILPLLQSATLAAAWAVFFPLDRLLKARIMRRAEALRRAHPELTVIGVTGSVGKTTVKELLHHLIPGSIATPVHVNSEVGVARWLIRMLSSDARHPTSQPLIVEMGAYRSGEIASICRMARPQIGVVTYVGSQHLALFGSEEAVFEAKSELVVSLPPAGSAFLNVDSPLTARMADKAPCLVTRVGTGKGADIRPEEIEETAGGVRFRLGQDRVDAPLHGSHNALNTALALAVAEHVGVPRATALERLRSYRVMHQTFEVRSDRGVLILDDTHNASPESMRAAIGWARVQPREPKVLLTAGLIELGESEERIHAELGAFAKGVFDEVIFLNDRLATAFERGFGHKTGSLNNHPKLPKDALLVCVGRMNPSAIQCLLPPNS